jgi:hypothetical protein
MGRKNTDSSSDVGSRRGLRGTRSVVLVAAAVALLAVLVPVSALAVWGQPRTLTVANEQAGLPTVASDQQGNVVAAWYATGGSDRVIARLSDDGGRTWGPRQKLGQAVVSQGGSRPALIRAAVGSNGTATVVWQRMGATHVRAVEAQAPSGGSFKSARPVSDDGSDAFYPDVAVSGSEAVVTFVTPTEVQRTVISPSGSVGTPQTVATGNSPDLPVVAADPQGDFFFAWIENTNTIPPQQPLVVVRETAGGRITDPRHLTADGSDLPQVALSDDRRATVAWEQTDGTDPAAEVMANTAAWGQKFGQAQQLSTTGALSILGGGAAGSRGVGVDDQGRVSAIWVEVPVPGPPGTSRVRVATSDPAGDFATPNTLQTANDPFTYERPAIAVADGGGLIATWTRFASTGRVWGAAAPAPRQFGTPVALSALEGDSSAVAPTSSGGHGVAVWGLGQSTGAVQAVRWVP